MEDNNNNKDILNIEKKILKHNSEIFDTISHYTKISVSQIKEFLKTPFDKEAKSAEMVRKYYNNPSNKYYHMSQQDILDMWARKANESTNNGSLVDDYIGLIYNNASDEEKEMFKLDHTNEKLDHKFKGIDIVLNDLKNNGYQFFSREKGLYMPVKYNDNIYMFSGRYDAFWLKPCTLEEKKIFDSDYILTIVDWKNSDNIQTNNKYGNKLLGPCQKMDDCDMNLFTIQLYLYIYMLKHEYNLNIPMTCCIIDFPSEVDCFFKIFKPNFKYDEKLISNIINFSIKKKILMSK